MFSDFGAAQAATLGGLVVALAVIVFLRRSARAKRAVASAIEPPADFKHLRAGRPYAVVRAFVDFDGETHPVGETWIYLGHAFAPDDDALSLHVRGDDDAERRIRLSRRSEDQGPIIDALAAYVQPSDG